MLTETGTVEARVFHGQTYRPAAERALQFAGTEGRLANLPDVIDARLASPVGTDAWETYLTSTTVEYLGYISPDSPAIVIAHRPPREVIARVATSDGVFIQQEFNNVLNGLMGPIEVIELKRLIELYGTYKHRGFEPYPNAFDHIMTADEAAENPLVRVRFGPRTDEYLLRHQRESRLWAEENDITDLSILNIIKIEAIKPLDYQQFVESKKPRAHLLVQSTLMDRSQGRERSLLSDTHYYKSKNDARVIGIRGQGKVTEIQS